jgi:hypothetical protein
MRLLFLACVFVCLPAVSVAQSFTVAWDHSPDPAAIGYTVYVGNQSGVYSVSSFDVGRALSAIINVPTYGTYYVALKSYDINGNRGAFSSEVSKTVEAPAPPPTPTGCVTGGISYGVGAEATWQLRTRDYDSWLAAREREGWVFVSAFNQNRNQLRVTIRCQGL